MKLGKAVCLYAIVLLGLMSCSALYTSDEGGRGTVALSFNGASLFSARNVTVASETSGYQLMVSINGDYTDSQIVSVQNQVDSYVITFADIPVGSDIYVRADVYNMSDPILITSDEFTGHDINQYAHFCHDWSGTSGQYTIQAGVNDISLSMTDMTDLPKSGEWLTDTAYQKTFKHENSGQRDYYLFLYPNNKYRIIYTQDSVGNPNWYKISEGTWRWQDATAKTSLYITECIYSDPGATGYTIVSYPKEVLYEREDSSSSITFVSASGRVVELGYLS